VSSEQRRIFTLAEATSMMPWVRSRLHDLQELKRYRDEAVRRLAGMTPAMRSNGSAAEGAALEARIDQIVSRMQVLLDDITAAGVEIKDIDAGLVDFPAIRGTRVVYLCWLIDESAITYWHEVDAGFSGRQRLDGFEQDDGG